MLDRRTHGLMQSKPPQTYCGLSTKGRKSTTDPFKVTCKDCKPVMTLMDEMPYLSSETEKRGRGRPKKGIFR